MLGGLDQAIAGLGTGGSVAIALAVALLLGLRHATDPDHLTAVSTLVMSQERRGVREAGRLGLAWGAGHGCALLVAGLPIVVFHDYLPAWLQSGLELAVGVVIVALAARLLMRWRRGYFHVHTHSHDGAPHAHVHMHDAAEHDERAHAHAHDLGRSPLASFGIGLVHGAGGSAGVVVLLLAGLPGRTEAIAALAVFALGTALSMGVASAALGHALGRGALMRRFGVAAPAFGAVSLAFGVWYSLAALALLPYL
jgi:cytochrome c biogenesis protein CcdA